MTRRYELLRVVTARTRGPGLFEPALPLGVDKPPAVFDEFAPGVSLGAGDGELGLKLGVNRLVVEDNGVAAVFLTNADPLQNPYSMFRFPVSLKKFPVPLHREFCR